MNKNLIFILLFSLLSYAVSAQTERIHKVRPGETFASISAKYGIEESDLLKGNPAISGCYVGAELKIPAKQVSPQENNAEVRSNAATGSHIHGSYGIMIEGLEAMKSGDYNQAKKVFTKVIKSTSDPSAYYYRGLCHYKNGKWKSAVSDLYIASISDELDSDVKSNAKDLLAVAKEYREEQVESRKETWATVGAVLGTAALVAGAVAVDSYMYSETGTTPITTSLTGVSPVSSYSSLSSSPYAPRPTSVPISQMSTAQFNQYMESEMSRLLEVSMAQVEQQNRAEYEMFCRFNTDASGNPLLTYDQWYAMKAQAWAETQQANNYSESSVSTTSTENQSSNPRTYTPRTPKTCGYCDGKGWVPTTEGVTDFGSKEKKFCAECNETVPLNHYHKTCPSCKGKGKW